MLVSSPRLAAGTAPAAALSGAAAAACPASASKTAQAIDAGKNLLIAPP